MTAASTCGAKGVALAAVVSVALAGCGSNDRAPGPKPGGTAARGGTLTYYLDADLGEPTDPQRGYNGRNLTNWSRTVYRSLLTFPVSTDPAIASSYVPDLGTDTGTSKDGARTWQFTVRDGATWQDGRPVTCEDFRYGASRVFATDVITGGPNYLLTYLDIPTDPGTGRSAYQGPYTKVGQRYFDRAVTCDGSTITYHFNKPWADFPLAIASLHALDPYRADQDRGAGSAYRIFSNGPYRLEGSWDPEKGGTLVRNEHYDRSTDSARIRKALPDRIVFRLGRSDAEVNELLIDDRGGARTAVTDQGVPATDYDRLTGSVADRTVTVPSPFVEYLVPNVSRLTDLRVRRALAASLDVAGWVRARGGGRAVRQATDVVNPLVPGYQAALFPGGAGDPEKSRQLLARAGVRIPYAIVLAIPYDPVVEKQAAALGAAWERGGFAVRVRSVAQEDYFAAVQDPHFASDLVFAGWGADWPSAMTVTPPLFDSRPNLTPTSNGQDFGNYRSTEFEALVDEAQRAPDLDTQTRLLQQADQVLADDVAYLPLDVPVFTLLRGSDVTGYVNTAASNSYPDLGAIGVGK